MTLQIPIVISHSLRQPFGGRMGDVTPPPTPSRRTVLGSLVWQSSYWIRRGGEHYPSKARRVEPERVFVWRVDVKLG